MQPWAAPVLLTSTTCWSGAHVAIPDVEAASFAITETCCARAGTTPLGITSLGRVLMASRYISCQPPHFLTDSRPRSSVDEGHALTSYR